MGDYFRLPNPIPMVLVPLGLLHTSVAELRPDLFPYELTGPIGTFTKFLVDDHPVVLHYIFLFMVVAHLGESAISFFIARNKGLSFGTSLKWSASVLLWGIFSFSNLLRYRPGTKKNS